MASFQILPPEKFDFLDQSNGPDGIADLRDSGRRQVSHPKVKKNQVNTLIYTMGDEADDILYSFGLTEADRKKYDTVSDKFEAHFVKRRNPIYERAKFNMRRQEEGEPVDSFITSLYRLAEHCNYRDLHDEMIRDRIVVGLRDAGLSEKLQTDPELILDKAITMARRTEAVRGQQPVVRGNMDNCHTRIDAVDYGHPNKETNKIWS